MLVHYVVILRGEYCRFRLRPAVILSNGAIRTGVMHVQGEEIKDPNNMILLFNENLARPLEEQSKIFYKGAAHAL